MSRYSRYGCHVKKMRSWCQFHEFTYFMPWKISRAIKISAHLCQFQPFHHDLTWFHQKMSWKKNTFFMSPGNSWTNRAARVSRIYIAMVDLNLRKSSKHSRTNIVLTAQDSCTSQHFDTGRASYTSIGSFFSVVLEFSKSGTGRHWSTDLSSRRTSQDYSIWMWLLRLHTAALEYERLSIRIYLDDSMTIPGTIPNAEIAPILWMLSDHSEGNLSTSSFQAKQSSSHRAVV
jgi:hypothetical protein